MVLIILHAKIKSASAFRCPDVADMSNLFPKAFPKRQISRWTREQQNDANQIQQSKSRKEAGRGVCWLRALAE